MRRTCAREHDAATVRSLDHHDEEAVRGEQSLPTFDLQ